MNFTATINGQDIGYSLVKLFPLTPGLNGQFFNMGHAGEGFYLTEDSGRLIGAYFTHDENGGTVWFTFDCQQTGSVYTGPVYLTQGGEMGVPHDPLESVEVGAITFTLGGEPDPDPPADPDPPSEPEPPEIQPNPFEGQLTFRIKPFRHPSWLKGSFMQSPDGTWYLIWSKPQIFWDSLRTGKNTMFEIEITALENLTNVSAGTSGPNNPKWIGVPDSIAVGETKAMRLELTKDLNRSGDGDSHFQLDCNLGTLVKYTAHIMAGT